MKTPLPKSIETQMEMYRADMAPLPEAFINFHQNLAVNELEILKSFGLEVISTEMKPDGWLLDSMKELNVRGILKEGGQEKIVYLHWHPGNQEFFIKSPSGGSYPFRLRHK